MRNLTLACVLFFVCNGINAQISGSSSPLSLLPDTATVIEGSITVGGTVDLTDATVQITSNYYNGDVLAFNDSLASAYGISGNYSVSSGVSGILSFAGTTSPANWQAIFRTVTYQNTLASCGPSSRNIVFIQGNYLYNAFSQHYYQYVPNYLNWVDAKAAAATSSFNGMQGYLATITSAGENNFVWKLLSADAWIGGSDDVNQINAATGTTTYPDQATANGNEYWVTGPEAGTQFSTGLYGPVPYNGAYMNWNGGEPNDYGDEFYTEFYSGNGGSWNDLNIYNSLPYVVEYGGMPNDIPQNNSFSRTLTLTNTTGGDITGGNVSVCSGTNSTVLTSTAAVSGVTILRWESSLDNFLTAATTIANTSATYTATDLTQTTYFRSIASGNSCAESPSSVTKITVGNSVAGNISADNTTICNGSVANLSLAGNLGTILKWQSSPDNSIWTDIADTTALYTTAPLSAGTYYYRALVQNTGCVLIATSNPITITATSGSSSVGGTLTGASLCPSPNSAVLILTGYTGIIQKWQSSTNGGVTWADIANTDSTYSITDLISSTSYRVSVQNGSCNAVNSITGNVIVNPLPVVAGIIGNSSVSLGSNISLSETTPSGIWSTDNAAVASVNANGVVTGVSLGTANISYTVTNGAGCTASATASISTVLPSSTEVPLVVDSVYYTGNPQNPTTPIDQVTGSQGASLIFYASASGGTGSISAASLPTQPGTYTYWVSQSMNGVESARVSFKVTIATPDVFVPKVFTPNGDGINDIIKPIIPGIKNFKFFKIYNRWGNLVYMSTNPDAGWDGTFKGNPQPKESYLWMIEGENMNGQLKSYSGMITLFR